jgi:hypothetical protein
MNVTCVVYFVEKDKCVLMALLGHSGQNRSATPTHLQKLCQMDFLGPPL